MPVNNFVPIPQSSAIGQLTKNASIGRWDLIQRFNKEVSFTITATILAGGESLTLQWVPPDSGNNSAGAESGGDAWGPVRRLFSNAAAGASKRFNDY